MLGWCVFVLCSAEMNLLVTVLKTFSFFTQSRSQCHIQNIFSPHSNLSGNSHRHTQRCDSNPKMWTMRISHCKVYLRPSTGTHLECLSAAEETGLQAEWYLCPGDTSIQAVFLLVMLDNVTPTKTIPTNASHFLPHQTAKCSTSRGHSIRTTATAWSSNALAFTQLAHGRNKFLT